MIVDCLIDSFIHSFRFVSFHPFHSFHSFDFFNFDFILLFHSISFHFTACDNQDLCVTCRLQLFRQKFVTETSTPSALGPRCYSSSFGPGCLHCHPCCSVFIAIKGVFKLFKSSCSSILPICSRVKQFFFRIGTWVVSDMLKQTWKIQVQKHNGSRYHTSNKRTLHNCCCATSPKQNSVKKPA